MAVKEKRGRLIGLDLFRIAAAAVVLAFHSRVHFGCSYGWLDRFISMGMVMMTGFFLLSGFSLYYTYQDKDMKENSNIKIFIIKRICGIFPLYYVTALIYIVFVGKENLKNNILLAPMELLAIQSVFPNTFDLTHNGGTWFISCIMICYLIFPFSLEFIKNMSLKGKWIFLSVSVGILFYAPLAAQKFQLGSLYSNPFFRVLEFMAGQLLQALMPRHGAKSKIQRIFANKLVITGEAAAMIAVIMIAKKAGIDSRNYMLYSAMVLPMFMVMIAGAACGSWKSLKRSKTIAYLSDISYAFFLTQLFIWIIMEKIVRIFAIDSNILKILLSFAVCTGIAAVLHEGIEKPTKNRLVAGLIRKGSLSEAARDNKLDV